VRALVISGGGSKGAFAGGVAQYLICELKTHYDIFVGSSTGSLLVSHLALNETAKIKDVYTSVDQDAIFSNCPFIVKTDKDGCRHIKINHLNVLGQILRGRKTFGESYNLKHLIEQTLTEEEFDKLKASGKDVVVTVSNLTDNQIEYKSIQDYDYKEYCEWVWISCNLIPFMTLVKKNNCEYADGGFGARVPIEEAIKRGATTVDVIVLSTEMESTHHKGSSNFFSLVSNLNLYMAERISRQNIRIGKLIAANKNVSLNFYYTPTVLTANSLVFDKEKMAEWWQMGYDFACKKSKNCNELHPLILS